MNVTIIGSGVIGLLSALVLTEARYRVTIIARDLPGDENQNWASPWAGAGFLPHPESRDQSLQAESFKYYCALAHRDPTSGVQVLKATEYFDDRDDDSSIWYKNIVPGYRRLGEDKLYPNAKIGFSYQTKKLEKRGVRFIQGEIKSFAEANKMAKTDVLVNATGLGAKELAGDDNVVPIRDQTIFMKTDFDEIAIFQGSHYTYVIPRMFSGGVIVGGVSQEGNYDREVDEQLRSEFLQRAKKFDHTRLHTLDLEKDVKRDIVAFRPGRRGGYRLEAEGDVVHAYGFAGLGYVYSYGAALKVRELVESVLAPRSRL
ncbi:hypothetical protein BDW69DRAFT_205024 [Aspergillus filifer]